MARKASSKPANSTAALGFEAKLWLAADKLRNNMDAAEYKHVVLGLIFLKYISDSFEEHHAKLLEGQGDYAGANPEDPDEYRAENIFWVPPAARWSYLQNSAKQPTIGKIVDDAMVAIERDNPRLKGVLPKDYARPALDKHRLGELIDLIGTISLVSPSPQPSPSGRGSHYRDGYDFSGLVDRARELRKRQTPAEDLLWELLRDRQLCDAKFRRQHQFGDYLCDFYCHDAKLVVECDGQPHEKADRIKHDAKRDAFLKAQGLTVLRFNNDRVLNNTNAVLTEVSAHLPSPSSRPPLTSLSDLPSPPGRRAGDEGRQNAENKESSASHRSVDLLGRVYEYFLTMFASAEGKNGGQFYTPSCVVRLLVEMLAPYKGRIYDPACGSGGMFVQSEKFVESHGGKLGDISIYGQESNANFAWVQHFIHHLAPQGMAGFVLANGSMSSNQSGEGDIRRALIEADLVDCMVALPEQLFYSTQIPVCLWFLRRDKSGRPPSTRPAGHPSPSGRRDGDEGKQGCDRRKQTLFVDARKMGTLIDRVHRELTDDDIAKIVGTYHAWLGHPHPAFGHPLPLGEGRGEGDPERVEKYQDVAGFCKSATTEDIASHSWVLTPGRYVGAEEVEDDGEPFEEKMPRLVAELHGQFAESAKLEAAIRANLKGLGYE